MTTLDAKKNGRYIKKNDVLHKVLKITDFSLADICETPITFHDNASANIIHEKLHLKEDLAETIRASHEINHIFTSSEERMIIRPLDFTEEWDRLRKRQASRTFRSEDEDEYDIDHSRNENHDEDSEPQQQASEPKPEEFGPGGLLDLPQQAQTVRPRDPHLPSPAQPEPELAPTLMAIGASVATDPISEDSYDSSQTNDREAPQSQDDFVPYASANPRSSVQVSPLERYPTVEELESMRAEAREEGYRQGYQSGEERATIESRGKVQAILEEVSNIVANLEGMQGAILKSAQENFHVITQNLIESVLHREFQINPEAFGAIIERAIEEALTEDEFKIFVNPKIAKELGSWSKQGLYARVKPDEALAGYDFRVEGQHATIDASIKQIVKDLMDQADLSLFETKEKVG